MSAADQDAQVAKQAAEQIAYSARHYAAVGGAPTAFTPLDSWSYSRWADYDKCPYYFKKKHIEKVKEPQGPALVKGNQFHEGMANYLLAKPGAAMPATKFAPLMAELRDFEDKIVEEKMAFTEAWTPTGYFAKAPQAAWLRVIWDVGLMYEDLTGEVCDHKTGKKYGSNKDQMELFALSFFCKFKPAKAVTTRLWYHESGDEDVMEFERAQVPELQAKWTKRAVTMLGDTVLPMKPNDKCKWCMHAKSAGGSCRFG
jgi:hypothetical protein